MRIFWGTVDKDGRVVSGDNIVTHQGDGRYGINVRFKVQTMPAIVGCQTRSGNLGEANTDGIVFPTLFAEGATANTGNNVGVLDDRSFCFLAAGETLNVVEPIVATRVLWGVIKPDGKTVSGSGGFTVTQPQDQPGQYVIAFPNQFSSLPAIAATQTNLGNLTESNRDGIVVPVLTTGSATLITGNNKSTPENRSFSFIAIGDKGPASTEITQPQYGPYNILWGSINANGTIAGGSGGFAVGRQAPGMYVITFPSFPELPAIIGSQTRSGISLEDNRDGMVFPWVNTNYAVAITGDADGNQQDRSFSFIAFGKTGPTNQE